MSARRPPRPALRAAPVAVSALARLTRCFTFDHSSSTALNSGLYRGCHTSAAPRASISARSFGRLWTEVSCCPRPRCRPVGGEGTGGHARSARTRLRSRSPRRRRRLPRPEADPPEQARSGVLCGTVHVPHTARPEARSRSSPGHTATMPLSSTQTTRAPSMVGCQRGELRPLLYDVGAESLDGSEGLFLSVSAMPPHLGWGGASVCPTVCWLTRGCPASASRSASTRWATDGSSSSHARSSASPSGVTRRGLPPARGARSTEPVSRLRRSQRPSEASPTAKRAATVGMEPSPRSVRVDGAAAEVSRDSHRECGAAKLPDQSCRVTLYRSSLWPSSPRTTVVSQWGALVDDFNTSGVELLDLVAANIRAREVPDVKVKTVTHRKAGAFSAKRLYLRVKRQNLFFDLGCGPYGAGYYFSWWLINRGGALLVGLHAAVLWRAGSLPPAASSRAAVRRWQSVAASPAPSFACAIVGLLVIGRTQILGTRSLPHPGASDRPTSTSD